jgi:hypothetical protein
MAESRARGTSQTLAQSRELWSDLALHCYESRVRAQRRRPVIWSFVALIVGAILVVAFGLSMLAAHDSGTSAARRLQPEQTILTAEVRARPPFACMKTHGDSSGAEVITSAKNDEREAACLYRRRALSGDQLATLNLELHVAGEPAMAPWFPAGAQISPSPIALGLWSALIALELCGAIWLARTFVAEGRTRDA